MGDVGEAYGTIDIERGLVFVCLEVEGGRGRLHGYSWEYPFIYLPHFFIREMS